MIMDGLDAMSPVADQLTLSFESYQSPTSSSTANSSSMLGVFGGRGLLESTGDDSNLNTPVMGQSVDANFSFINPEFELNAEAPPITGK